MKFKKGDKVEFVSSYSENARFFKKGLTNLTIKEVTEFDENIYYVWESDKSVFLTVCKYELQLISQPTKQTKNYLKEKPQMTIETLAILLIGAISTPTDLEKRTSYTVVVYTPEGTYNSTAYFKSETEAESAIKKFLQTSKGIGCTCTIHKEIKAFTTEIPVVIVKD